MDAVELARLLDERGFAVPAPWEHPVTGVQESRWIAPASLVAAAEAAKAAGYFFESMTCVDRIEARQGFELLYTFNRYAAPSRVMLRVFAPQGDAVPSLSGVFGIAAWNEREAWEFYGLAFSGHPNLTWLLLPDDTEFRPLLKSFTAPPPSIFDESINPDIPTAGGRPH